MSWDKIWLLEGCPYYIEWFVEDLRNDLGHPNVIRLDSNSSSVDFISVITSFPFFDVPDLVIVQNADAEILNACLSNINNIRCSGIVFTSDYNTFDGRQSFVTKASKNKRLKTFDYHEQGDDLKSFLKEWQKRVKFSNDCLSWLNKNAPTRLAKAKINGQKKEIIIIDLLQIDKELNKIYSLYLNDKSEITPQDLNNYCNFTKESEIWNFLDSVIAGDLPAITNYFINNKLTTSNEGPLWVISSQLELYLQIKSGCSADNLTLSNKLNFYLDDNFQAQPEIKSKPPINPYRLKMANESCKKVTIESIVQKYLATINAIRDLRAGMSPDLVSGVLAFAYAGKCKYAEPYYDV